MKFFNFLIISLIANYAVCQSYSLFEKFKHTGLSVKYQYGFITDKNFQNYDLIKGHIKGIEITLNFPTYGLKPWHQLYRYPETGISYIHYNLANQEQLGTADGFIAHINFSAHRFERFQFYLRFGSGLGYISKPFDLKSNHKNHLIGSHFNVILHSSGFFKVQLYKNLNLNSGLSFSHFSNGELKLPNDGLNIASVNIGLEYLIGQKPEKIKIDPEKTSCPKSKFNYCILLNSAIKEVRPILGQKYMSYAALFEVTKDFHRKYSAGIGADLFYDLSNIEDLKLEYLSYNNNDIIKVGFNAAYLFRFDKITFEIITGLYLRNKIKDEEKIYNKIGLRYMIYKHLFINIHHKSHFFFKGDYIGWGIGVVL